jgi:hypothetical protein
MLATKRIGISVSYLNHLETKTQRTINVPINFVDVRLDLLT